MKYGLENVVWFLLESCSSDQTLICEQKWLDLLRPFVDEFGGFNINHFANRPPSRKGTKLTEEQKDKLSQAHKGKSQSDEHIYNNSKDYEFINPQCVRVKIHNLQKFCKENDLARSHMW